MSANTRVDRGDLSAAAEWLETYEGSRGDEFGESVLKVAKWLRREADNRLIREVAKEHGKPVGEMRKLIADAVAHASKGAS